MKQKYYSKKNMYKNKIVAKGWSITKLIIKFNSSKRELKLFIHEKKEIANISMKYFLIS